MIFLVLVPDKTRRKEKRLWKKNNERACQPNQTKSHKTVLIGAQTFKEKRMYEEKKFFENQFWIFFTAGLTKTASTKIEWFTGRAEVIMSRSHTKNPHKMNELDSVGPDGFF
jgi:hypothetical protein